MMSASMTSPLPANCSHGLFYHYFTGKEDIFNALMKLKEEKYKDALIPQTKALDAGGIRIENHLRLHRNDDGAR
jgi:AcrR family transcriptional regulator